MDRTVPPTVFVIHPSDRFIVPFGELRHASTERDETRLSVSVKQGRSYVYIYIYGCVCYSFIHSFQSTPNETEAYNAENTCMRPQKCQSRDTVSFIHSFVRVLRCLVQVLDRGGPPTREREKKKQSHGGHNHSTRVYHIMHFVWDAFHSSC